MAGKVGGMCSKARCAARPVVQQGQMGAGTNHACWTTEHRSICLLGLQAVPNSSRLRRRSC